MKPTLNLSQFFASLDHPNTPTEKDYKLSNLGNKIIMKEVGNWKFDAKYSDDPFAERCSKKMGRISTQFQGYGVGKLMYGNCGKGKVEVRLNGKKVEGSLINKNTPLKTLEFHFAPFDKLELVEKDDDSVLDLISLNVGPRGILHGVKIYTSAL